jgi:hypothetical protein
MMNQPTVGAQSKIATAWVQFLVRASNSPLLVPARAQCVPCIPCLVPGNNDSSVSKEKSRLPTIFFDDHWQAVTSIYLLGHVSCR